MDGIREVFFTCEYCNHKGLSESDSPCYDCLNMPYNYESNLPMYFEGDKEKAIALREKYRQHGKGGNQNG